MYLTIYIYFKDIMLIEVDIYFLKLKCILYILLNIFQFNKKVK